MTRLGVSSLVTYAVARYAVIHSEQLDAYYMSFDAYQKTWRAKELFKYLSTPSFMPVHFEFQHVCLVRSKLPPSALLCPQSVVVVCFVGASCVCEWVSSGRHTRFI